MTEQAGSPARTGVTSGEDERTIGQLVASATQDLSGIMRDEVALAKVEIKNDVMAAGKGAAMFVVAGVLAFLALILLLIAAAYGLRAAGLPAWAAFLIVAGVLLLITAVLALLGRSALSKMQGGPKRTIKEAKATVAAVKPGA